MLKGRAKLPVVLPIYQPSEYHGGLPLPHHSYAGIRLVRIQTKHFSALPRVQGGPPSLTLYRLSSLTQPWMSSREGLRMWVEWLVKKFCRTWFSSWIDTCSTCPGKIEKAVPSYRRRSPPRARATA